MLPPEVSFDEVAAVNLLRSLNLVFDGCAIDRECGTAFPSLRQRFAELIARADRKPLDLGLDGVVVRGAQVVDAIYNALHDERAIPYVPLIIDNAAAGRYDELRSLVKSNQGPSSFTWGMRYSVWCAEEMPFENAALVKEQVAPSLGLGGIDERTTRPEVCRAWNVKPAPAVENEPVRSDVPVLIFAGEFDPDTPPDWGRQQLESLSNARYVEMRGRSHGAGFSRCGGEIAAAFLRAPSASLPVDCALTLRGADFGGSAQRTRPP